MFRPFYPTLPPLNLSAVETSNVAPIAGGSSDTTEISLRVVNTGSKPAYLAFGKNSNVSASSTTGMAILPGAPAEVFNWPIGYTHLAYACAPTETTTVQVQSGRGGV